MLASIIRLKFKILNLMNCSTTRICWISTLLKQKRNRNFDPLYLGYTHISYTAVIAYEARYNNLGAAPILDTAGIWILAGYHCMRTPGLSPFFPKKKISRYGLGTSRAESCQNYVVFSTKIIQLSQSLSLNISLSVATLSLDSLSLTSSLYWRQSSIGMRNKRWSKEIQIQEN